MEGSIMESQRLADEEKARKSAAAAPDKAKLTTFAAHIRTMEIPDVKSPEALAVIKRINSTLNDLAKWVDAEASKI